jgi:signal transduction histidine kinase
VPREVLRSVASIGCFREGIGTCLGFLLPLAVHPVPCNGVCRQREDSKSESIGKKACTGSSNTGWPNMKKQTQPANGSSHETLPANPIATRLRWKFYFRSIRSRFLFWILLVSLLPLLALITAVYYNTSRLIRQDGVDKLVAIRDLKANQIDSWAEANISQLNTIANDPLIRSFQISAVGDQTGDDFTESLKKIAKRLRDYLVAYHDIKDILLIGAEDGRVYASATGQADATDWSEDPVFTEPMGTGTTSITEATFSETLQIPSITLSTPVFGPTGDGEIIAILATQIDLRHSLYKLTNNRIGMGETGETLLVDQQGRAITELRWRENPKLTVMITAAPAVQSGHGATGTIEAQDYRGEMVLAAYTYIDAMGWGLVSKQDTEELYAPVTEMTRMGVFMFLFISMVTSVIGIAIAFFMSRRIKELCEVTRHIGSGDLTRTAPIRGGDEITELASHTNEMVCKLSISRRELESFSYSVSHDLRAPLRGIDGFSQILLEDYEDKLDEEGKSLLREIRTCSTEMGALIDALLALSRITRKELEMETVDLSAIARTVLDKFQKDSPEREVDVSIQSGLIVRGDRTLLTSALSNLLGNAWKFTGKTSQAAIAFGATSKNGETVFFVRDNGAGFSMEYASKLFGAFQRLHAQADFPGTGIGLANVQRIVTRYGGRIWADGEKSKGATFYFTLEIRGFE